MLAYDVASPPVGADFDFEIKFDGFRCGLIIGSGIAKLISRQGKIITGWFPELAELPTRIAAEAVLLDGEIISGDGGTESFNHLLRRARLRGKAPKDSLSISFVAFDLLFQDGRDWMVSSLSERRAQMRSLVTENDRIAISRVFDDGPALLALAATHGLEGVVAKDRRAIYEPGKRSRTWLKTKIPGAHLAHEWNGDVN